MKIYKNIKMYNKYIYGIRFFGILFVFLFSLSFVKSSDIIVSIDILPWEITRWASSNLSLGQISLDDQNKELSWQFEDDFWINDLKWHDNGYNTMIVSDWLIWPNWNILTGIYLMAGNGNRPVLDRGVLWDVRINDVFSGNYHSIYWDPVVYIYRPVWPNNWKINKYKDRPWIKIVVPPYTSPWTYSGTIYFDVPGN